MHPCAALLEEIIALCRVEGQALAEEDVDKAEELANRRYALIQKAWDLREGFPEEELHASLLTIRDEQTRLHSAAEALHDKLRERQHAGRKQTKYFNQDRHIQSQLRRSFYCDKIS